MTGTGSWGLKAIVIEVTFFFEHPPNRIGRQGNDTGVLDLP